MTANAVVVDNITKRYGSVRAVTGLSVTVPTGTIYGFLGPNGAGKTSTLRMIMNIFYPDSGRITVINCRTEDDVRRTIGYMPEERGLYRKMTVAKVLEYLGAIKGMSHTQIRHAIPRWLTRVNLADWADRRVEELSRGMHQKLQFVATVLSDPDILILDEPFSGLDPVNAEALERIIVDMRREGKTIIFSTHQMEQAERLCDRFVLINRGRAVVEGTLNDVRKLYPCNAVLIEHDDTDDASFLDTLPGVVASQRELRHIELTLSDTTDPQHILAAIAPRLHVHRFEVKRPSLHEMFVRLVEHSNEHP
jgi:ABC-2 type transport system ATP-binding protein